MRLCRIGTTERPLRIDALIFDLDNTLWDVEPVILRAEEGWPSSSAQSYPRVLEHAGHDACAARLMIEHPTMQHDFTWLRLELLRRLASEAGYPEGMARQAFDVFFRARNEVVLYDDVLPALTTLHTRCRLFALSNGNADLAAIGLSRFFERSLCAKAGVLKPDPRRLPAARRCGSRCRVRGARGRRSGSGHRGCARRRSARGVAQPPGHTVARVHRRAGLHIRSLGELDAVLTGLS